MELNKESKGNNNKNDQQQSKNKDVDVPESINNKQQYQQYRHSNAISNIVNNTINANNTISNNNGPDSLKRFKNQNQNNNTYNEKGFHRRGKSLAHIGELQGSSSLLSSKNFNNEFNKVSKDDSENKSDALESLQQIIASLKNLPAVPPNSKNQINNNKKETEDNNNNFNDASKHKRHESNTGSIGRKTNTLPTPHKQHKKGASVSFFFPSANTSTSLKSAQDHDDGSNKPMNIENALQDTLTSLRRMSQDKGKTQKDKETDKKYDIDDDENKKSKKKKNISNNNNQNNSDNSNNNGNRKSNPSSSDEVILYDVVDKRPSLLSSSSTDNVPSSPKSPFDFKKLNDEHNHQQSPAKNLHRRHQSLGFNLFNPAALINPNVNSPPVFPAKSLVQAHGRRHSVALNNNKDIMKELEKNQTRTVGNDGKGHRRNNSRNFESNWRSTASPLSVLAQPFNQFQALNKFGISNQKKQQNQQNSNQQQRKSLFAPYLPQASLPSYLKAGELVSGVLRINKRNRSDAYVTTESLDTDIYICGSKDRNRALEGDIVAVQLLDPEKVWQTKKEKEEKKRKKEESAGIDKKKVDKKKDDVEVEGQGLLLFEDDEVITDDQRPKYCGHVVAVMERMPGQMFSGTLALLRPSSSATKEREAAEKARREAEDRANGIVPKPEESNDKKDERTERPKIVWFKPTDKRVPLIAIPTEQAPEDFVEKHQSYAQQLFVACIKRWPITSLHPFGTLVAQIGEIGNIEVETQALIKDNNISTEEFNENVLKCLPQTPWVIPEKEIESRRDLRSTRIFTIDPLINKDLDDAISCTRLPDGNYEIGVHVADVSYFVKPNSLLDRESRKRATSVYLVQKNIPMLPHLLSEDLCSLDSGVDRLAFSVFWNITPEGRSSNPRFAKTIIRSCAKLSYIDAQGVIEGKSLNPNVKIYNDHSANEIEADIKVLNELSQKMRELRHKRGALSLSSIKLEFDMDENLDPTECHVYKHKEANNLIEEFMLLANISVAQKISSSFPEQALLRRHAAPVERKLKDFLEHATRFGYEFYISSASALQKSFDKVDNEDAKEILELLAIKPLQKAKYFCTGTLDIIKYQHYALNVPLYTHFTSPIRRYADILVHRMLEAALSGDKKFYLDKDNVQKTANYCNVKKEAAKNAQEQSSHLFLCVLLNNLTVQSGPVIREAIVVSVKEHAFDVLVPVFGIEKRVHLDQLPLERFILNNEKMELTLVWKQGVSSLEPISDDYIFVAEEEEEGLDVDEEALLADDNDDYHYEMMDVTSLPMEDEHRLFDNNSDVGDDDDDDVDRDDETQNIGDAATSEEVTPISNDHDKNTENDENDISSAITPVNEKSDAINNNITASSPEEVPLSTSTSALASASTNKPPSPITTSTPVIKQPEVKKLSIVSDPTIPTSQIIRELTHLNVIITADCKKSPPVIKVSAVNPFA